MKNFFAALFTTVIFASLFSSCTKQKCTGGCTDLTTSLTGQFNGNYVWTDGGTNIAGQAIAQITKVNDSLVNFQLNGSSPVDIDLQFNATVTPSDSGYYLKVDSIAGVAGAAAYYNSAHDGYYISATKKMTVYIEFLSPGETYMTYTATL